MFAAQVQGRRDILCQRLRNLRNARILAHQEEEDVAAEVVRLTDRILANQEEEDAAKEHKDLQTEAKPKPPDTSITNTTSDSDASGEEAARYAHSTLARWEANSRMSDRLNQGLSHEAIEAEWQAARRRFYDWQQEDKGKVLAWLDKSLVIQAPESSGSPTSVEANQGPAPAPTTISEPSAVTGGESFREFHPSRTLGGHQSTRPGHQSTRIHPKGAAEEHKAPRT